MERRRAEFTRRMQKKNYGGPHPPILYIKATQVLRYLELFQTLIYHFPAAYCFQL